MKKFYWIHKDYQNESLNNLARRLVEYNTADLLSNGYDVFYTDTIPTDGSEYEYAGKLAVGNFSMAYSVADIPVINDIFNYNLYFPTNTQDPLRIPVDVKGTFASDDEVGFFFNSLKQMSETLSVYKIKREN